MRNKLLIGFAILGVMLAIGSAYITGIPAKPQPPAFKPASNPYAKGIYANGIVETPQASGENINLYPEVPGTVVKILVAEGQHVKAGTPLLILDDSVQRATTASAKAQIEVARATSKNLQDQYGKLKTSSALDSRSVSKDALDTAENASRGAKAGLELAQKQYEAANALLAKYSIKALSEGTVLSVNTAVGSYISSQGVYSSYTGAFRPVMVLGNTEGDLAVRCYIDEILIHRIPNPAAIEARMFIHGTDINIPLKFVRIQPNVTPKIQLSSQRAERVDVRVLPVIFSFENRKGVVIYPGQLVDVYIGEKHSTPKK
jgi:HlyD family secretion protein